MAQDTTPAIVIYQGDGSNNVFSIPFDKGQYGDVKVAFVRRGLTDYVYSPDTYTIGDILYAWTNTDGQTSSTIYTKTPIPFVPDPEDTDPDYTYIYDEYGNKTTYYITAYENDAIQINFDTSMSYTRDTGSDIERHSYLVWNGDTLNVGDYICIVRDTERGQPYVFPNNQKHIEGALDNLERQIQELKFLSDNVLIVDPIEGSLSPIEWIETIIRCTDLSARELRYYNGWLQYSLIDPKSAAEDKEWFNLLNTDNIKNLFYRYTEDEQGRPLYNVYYTDKNGVEHLLAYDAETQRIDIETLKEKVEANRQNIEAEKLVRRVADDELRQLISSTTYDVSQFDARITQNTNNISSLDGRLDSTVTASDKAMPKSYIDSLVSGIYHIKGVKATVDELPTEGNVTGDCWNVLADGNTYIWTEDGEWVSGGAAVDFSPYRRAVDQDIIDAGKQDKLTAGTDIEITANNTINMTGKFGTTISSAGKNLKLLDQDGVLLSETMVSLGVDAVYDTEEEDIEFEDDSVGDVSFLQEQIDAINAVVPDNATSSNQLVTETDIGNGILTIQRNNVSVGTFSANAKNGKNINITVPTTAADVGALPDTTRYAATMEASINQTTYVMTMQLRDQNGSYLGDPQTVDLPLESVVVSGRYDAANKKIILVLENGTTIDIPVGDLIAGLQTEITPQNKLSSDLVDDTNKTHKFVTEQDKTSWNNKVTKTNEASKVYGTDAQGNQTTYGMDSFGSIDNIEIHGVAQENVNKTVDLSVIEQMVELPAPSSTYDGRVVQYIGETTQTLTHNCFYECTSRIEYTDATRIVRSASEQLVASADIETFLQSGLDTNTPYLYEKRGAYWDCIDPAGVTISGPRAGLVVGGVVNTNDQIILEVDSEQINEWAKVTVQSDVGVEDVLVNGTSVVTNNVANVTVPTKVSDLTNDSNFQTATDVSTAISTHNADVNAHQDIRDLIDSLDEWTPTQYTATTTNFVVGNPYTVEEAFQRTASLFEGHQDEITAINDKIPAQATAQNQLADKAFVNSTVATNAANFRGNWATWNDVPTQADLYPVDYAGNRTPTNNDYMVIDDATGYGSEYDGSWRFIYVGTWATDGKNGWNPTYRVGTAFTQAQQAAIDSGITANMVDNYVNPTSTAATAYNARITAVETDKRDIINSANKVYATDSIGANKNDLVYDKTATADTIAQRGTNGVLKVGTPVDNADATTKQYVDAISDDLDDHIDDKNNPHEVTKAQVGLGNVDNTSDLNKPISTATQTALNSKQDIISDLSTIRSGAALGATAVQPGGNISDLTNDSGFITSASVATLTDVTLTDLADGQVLVYDSANSKWVNDDQHGGVTATYDATTKTITFA